MKANEKFMYVGSPILPYSIPHICRKYHNEICGEKIVMWRNFGFLCMTTVEKSEISLYTE